eukprot:9475032-Pyramimonas_sp.AAC.1
MYGMFLPIGTRSRVKLFEIGLGCTSYQTTKGASAQLWRKLFPRGELWFAEFDAACVTRLKGKGVIDDINVVVGDQGKVADLESWVTKTGGSFDVIIDDGSHRSRDILTSFNVLWYKALKPGGLYFIEDLHVGRGPAQWYNPNTTGDHLVFSDVLQDWQEQMLIDTRYVNKAARFRNPLPDKVKWIFCQHRACVLAKCAPNDGSKCSPFL